MKNLYKALTAFIFGLLFILVVLTVTGCPLEDATGLDRRKTYDNRSTHITINEATGESFYLDADGWTWIIDRFGNVIDGPFDIEGTKDPEAVKPEFPNPPPPFSTPEPAESGMGWLFILVLLPGLSGCVAVGENARVQWFERAEVQPSLALSVGSGTQAGAATSQKESDVKMKSAEKEDEVTEVVSASEGPDTPAVE